MKASISTRTLGTTARVGTISFKGKIKHDINKTVIHKTYRFVNDFSSNTLNSYLFSGRGPTVYKVFPPSYTNLLPPSSEEYVW